MQEQLITPTTLLLAQSKSFNMIQRVITVYDEDTPEETQSYEDGVTQALLQKWLREKHNILVEPSWEGTHEIYSINYRIIILGNTIYKDFRGCFDGQSYEEALEAGLQEALKLINNYE